MSNDKNDGSGNKEKKDTEQIKKELQEYESELEDELHSPPLPFFFEPTPKQEESQVEAAVEPQEAPAHQIVEESAETAAEEAVLIPEKQIPQEQSAAEVSLVEEEKQKPEPAEQSQAAEADKLEATTEETRKQGAITVEEPVEDKPTLTEEETEELIKFEAMLEQYMPEVSAVQEGDIIKVPVVAVRPDYVLVDLGGKSEGVIKIEELYDEKGEVNVTIGDQLDILVEGRDEDSGQIIVSHLAAKKYLSLDKIRQAFDQQVPISGKVVQLTRGGLIVDAGIPCFMPASQVDLKRVDDLSVFLGQELQGYVIDFDPQKRKTILSRRRLLEDEQDKLQQALLQNIKEGDIVKGKVKSILDFGVFVDLGGLDGFLPRSELSWETGIHPSEMFKEGNKTKLKVIALDYETKKITLSRRQLKPDPWEVIDTNYPVGKTAQGKVVNITNYGAFVKLEEGLTGLVHVSDMSWATESRGPDEFVQLGQSVEVAILSIDKENRRLSLGFKQITEDPWSKIEEKYPRWSKVKARVISLTNASVMVKLDHYTKGIIHVSDLSWERKISHPSQVVKPDQDTRAVVLDYDSEHRLIRLGIKQLQPSPFEQFVRAHPVGSLVTGRVVSLVPFGAIIELEKNIQGLLHISQIADRRIADPAEVLQAGERLELKITKIDINSQRISLSRKELLRDQEKQIIKSYLKKQDKGAIKLGEFLKDLDIQPDSKPEETSD